MTDESVMKNRLANSVDFDETARYEPSYLDLHCLLKGLMDFVCFELRLKGPVKNISFM